jgi:hypothetical protein
MVVTAVNKDGSAGGEIGSGVGDVGVNLDAAGVAGRAGEEDAIGETLKGPVGVVGVGGEEALERLDAIVVVVEDIALEAEAVGEEIGDVEGGVGGLAEVFEDAAEGGVGECIVDGGGGGG